MGPRVGNSDGDRVGLNDGESVGESDGDNVLDRERIMSKYCSLKQIIYCFCALTDVWSDFSWENARCKANAFS